MAVNAVGYIPASGKDGAQSFKHGTTTNKSRIEWLWAVLVAMLHLHPFTGCRITASSTETVRLRESFKHGTSTSKS